LSVGQVHGCICHDCRCLRHGVEWFYRNQCTGAVATFTCLIKVMRMCTYEILVHHCTGGSARSPTQPPKSGMDMDRSTSRAGPPKNGVPGDQGKLWHTLWDSQLNATLASVAGGVILAILIVFICHGVMNPLQPQLERQARAQLAMGDEAWQLCPQLLEYSDRGEGSVADFAHLGNSTTMSCSVGIDGAQSNFSDKWQLNPEFLHRLALSAVDGCSKVPSYCYVREDLQEAASSGKMISNYWGPTADDPYCRRLAASSAIAKSNSTGDIAYLHDALTFNHSKAIALRFFESSDTGRVDYVFDGTSKTNFSLAWLLECAVHPMLRHEEDVDAMLLNVTEGPRSIKIRECLVSRNSTVRVKVDRAGYFPEFYCFKGVIDTHLSDFQSAFDMEKLQYRSSLFGMTYDNLYACYTGLLGGVIAGVVLLVGNVFYQMVLWSCKRCQKSSCCSCLECSDNDCLPCSEVRLPWTTKVPSPRYR
jgi:hypothetical protein